MNTFKATLETAKGLALLREVDGNGQKYLCFTKFSDVDSLWVICASNGTDVWRTGLTEDEIEENVKQKGPTYLSDVCCIFESGIVHVMKLQSHLLLTLKCETDQYEFNLFELPAAERRKEIEYLVFQLSAQLLSTRKQLKECEQHLQDMAKTSLAAEHSSFPESKNKAKQAAKPKKPIGHSLVNPSSKKRKTAKGVVFGDDS